MLKGKVFLILAVLAAIALHESEGTLLLKAKILKAPLVIAKLKEAKEVQTKVAIATIKKVEAIKAKTEAIKSIVQAPFKIAKTAAKIKLGAIKAIAAIKAAKIGALLVKKKALLGIAGHTALKAIKPKKVIKPIYLPIPVPKPLLSSYLKTPLDDARSVISTLGNAFKPVESIPIAINQPVYRYQVAQPQIDTVKVIEPHAEYGIPNFK